VELDGWVCCGASSAHSASGELATDLPAINIALAQEAAHGDLLAPCAACFNRTKTADYTLRHDPARRGRVEEAVEFKYTGVVHVRNPLEVVITDVGLDSVAAKVTGRLAGLKVVSYYGCLLVRPPKVMEFDNPENPTAMNRILQALGADVRPWSYAVDCCGGSASLPRVDIAVKLVTSLAEHALEAGADAIVTACPMCQMNLEMRQALPAGKQAVPIFYFTELMGLAWGLPETSGWWGKHLISPVAVLRSAGLV
jgi:heterodisulfide reductase subunit B